MPEHARPFTPQTPTSPSAPSSLASPAGVYEGKAKIVRPAAHPGEVEIYFKDDATAFNGQKKAQLEEKGWFNARIAALVFRHLAASGVPTHFLGDLDDRTHRALRVNIVPVEVVVRNVAAGSLVKRLGIREGTPLDPPLMELYFKDDALGDPLINDDHVRLMGLTTPERLAEIRALALRINDLLRLAFKRARLVLVDFKLEFGEAGGTLLLADEISPDTCRLWDSESGKKLDKDRFRHDLGDVMGAYREVHRRLQEVLG